MLNKPAEGGILEKSEQAGNISMSRYDHLHRHEPDTGASSAYYSMTDGYPLPQKVGSYRLLRELARGSSSKIYLGEHECSRAQVAVKLLNQPWDKEEVAKFLVQAAILSHLRHPNIVQVLDFGTQGEIAFLVMDYAPHGTLRQRHPRGSIVPLEQVISYVKQVAAALNHVHRHRLIHQDVKPHNMLVGPHDEIMLGDFGTAVIAEDFEGSQQTLHDFEGTILYAAPEQLQGKPRFCSDQYALAVVVYEWLSGTCPFTGNLNEVVHQHLFTPPPPLSKQQGAVPPEVAEVVYKALAKQPTKRFPSTIVFASALEKAAQMKQTEPIRHPELVKLRFRMQKRNRHQFISPLPFSEEMPL